MSPDFMPDLPSQYVRGPEKKEENLEKLGQEKFFRAQKAP
jgi:hypothetical protein